MRGLTTAAAVLLVLLGCGEQSRLDVDVSDINVAPVQISRFDKAVFENDTGNIPALRASLEKTYNGFYIGYTERIICPGSFDQPICNQQFKSFISDPAMREVYEACKKKYADLSGLEKEIQNAYKYFRYHFPQRTLPKKVHAMMSGFNYNISQVENEFGIGLEMYLGKTPYYSRLQWPLYRQRKLDAPYMLPDFVRAWMMNEFPLADEKGDLLTRMIYDGKIMYLTEALLPQTHDTLRLGYTARQLEWAQAAEAEVWAYLIEKKLVYNTNVTDILPLVNDGPFTTGFSHDSPPRLASWIGLQIVRTYMENNPSVSLEELMKLSDAQTILTRSKYKPKF